MRSNTQILFTFSLATLIAFVGCGDKKDDRGGRDLVKKAPSIAENIKGEWIVTAIQNKGEESVKATGGVFKTESASDMDGNRLNSSYSFKFDGKKLHRTRSIEHSGDETQSFDYKISEDQKSIITQQRKEDDNTLSDLKIVVQTISDDNLVIQLENDLKGKQPELTLLKIKTEASKDKITALAKMKKQLFKAQLTSLANEKKSERNIEFLHEQDMNIKCSLEGSQFLLHATEKSRATQRYAKLSAELKKRNDFSIGSSIQSSEEALKFIGLDLRVAEVSGAEVIHAAENCQLQLKRTSQMEVEGQLKCNKINRKLDINLGQEPESETLSAQFACTVFSKVSQEQKSQATAAK
jgi:hypothetical protein